MTKAIRNLVMSPIKQGAIVLLLGLMLTGSLVWLMMRYEERVIISAVEKRAEHILDESRDKVFKFQYGLRGLRGTIAASGKSDITFNEFERYSATRDLKAEFPGAMGIGYIIRVPAADEAAFIARMKADGRPNFAIRMLSPHNGEKFIIEYVSPKERNQAAFGLDVASETNRHRAAMYSMKTGTLALTGPITLVQKTGAKKQSFLLMLPYYGEANVPATEAERLAKLKGWTYAPLSIADILQGIDIDPNQEQVEIIDVTDEANPSRFYLSTHKNQSEHQSLFFAGSDTFTKQVSVFSRDWRIIYHAEPLFIKRLNLPSIAGIAGIGAILSILSALGWFSWQTAQWKARLVLKGQSKLAAIVDSSTDAIIGKDLDGRVISWNAGAEKLFGYSAEEAIGNSIAKLIIPHEMLGEESEILDKVRSGKILPPFETTRRRKDGTLLPVSIAVAPIFDEYGRIIGASKTARDITHQKAAEQKVAQINAELEYKVAQRTKELTLANRENAVLLDTIKSQFFYAMTNRAGVMFDVNEVLCNVLGYSREEMIGESLQRIGANVHLVNFWDDLWTDVAENGAWHGEFCTRSKDGHEVWFDAVIASLPGNQKYDLRYFFIGIDTTERRQKDERIQRLNAQFQGVLNAASEISIIATDLEGVITVFNTGAQRMLGYTEEEMVGKVTPAVVHLRNEVIERGNELSEQFGETIEGFRAFVHIPELEGAENREWTYVRKDGSHIKVMLCVTANKDSSGKIIGYLGVAIDITQEQEQKAMLVKVAEKMELAAKVAKLGIWEWDMHSQQLSWNDEMFNIYGYHTILTPQELTQENWFARIHPDDYQMVTASFEPALTGEGGMDLEYRIVLPTGEVRTLKALSYVVHDSQNQDAIAVVGINIDITKERNYESSLLEAKQLAEQGSIAKSQFLANMSHEIRTPLNAVLGLLQLLQKTELTARQADYTTKARSSARSLLDLLNDILDFSKIEAGKMEIANEEFSLETLLRELADVLVAYQGGKPIEVLYAIDPKVPLNLIGDSVRIKQVLINLAGNAIKFTEQGSVSVAVELLKSDSQQAKMRFSVVDTGIGISEEQLQRLFQSFVQAESSTSRKYGGTGLGLVISKRLIDQMNAELLVRSEVGVGSTFWFELTLPIGTRASILNLNVLAKPLLKVLIVEDNTLTAGVLMSCLPKEWKGAAIAHSGRLAIDMLQSAYQDGHPFDVVLMDWEMPEMDGIETAYAIKALPEIGATTHIVMSTAHGTEAFVELEGSGSAPFDGYLTKPFTPQQFLDAVAIIQGEASPLLFSAIPNTTSLQNVRILVVEDNPLNRQVASELLEGEGAIVTLAEGGEIAIDKLLQAETFDLILMDVQMPDMDGYEATRRIREFNQEIPIIALTANVALSDKVDCLNAGMNDHIGKPIDIEQVVSVVSKYTHLVAPIANTKSLSKPQEVEENASQRGLIEPIKTILGRYGHNANIYLRTLESFVSSKDQLLGDVVFAIENNHHHLMAGAWHALKGVAATIGASELSQLASENEKLAKNNKETAASLFTQIDIEKTTSLIEDSVNALFEQLDPIIKTKQKSNKTEKSSLSSSEVEEKIASLVVLLENNNLEALKLAEELAGLIDSSDKTLQQAMSSVSILQFDAALSLLKDRKRS
ncbi:PAS domain S-box protein [Leeia sp. TBRC 13508]|uniref:histidine kinase n=1 Tax=Leeia speluncae TaxID=2884804 RepID=A0ABS8D7R6_9NEIS|nr:PAS domain S-box protein [Leeia speluncae]MCB6184206.1 PAS domain S-box protein [Leeia speluncae]